MEKDETLQALRELRELDDALREDPTPAPDPGALFVGIMCALCILSGLLLWWISQ